MLHGLGSAITVLLQGLDVCVARFGWFCSSVWGHCRSKGPEGFEAHRSGVQLASAAAGGRAPSACLKRRLRVWGLGFRV